MKPPGGGEIQIKFGVYDVFLLFILADLADDDGLTVFEGRAGNDLTGF